MAWPSDPFAEPEDLVVYYDATQVAQLLRDDGTEGDASTITNNAHADYTLCNKHLKAASGDVVRAAVQGGKYDPDDLLALAGGDLEGLKKLVCRLAFWSLYQRRRPDASVDDVAGAAQALKDLESIRLGRELFNVPANVAASLPSSATQTPQSESNPRLLTADLWGLFGNRTGRRA